MKLPGTLHTGGARLPARRSATWAVARAAPMAAVISTTGDNGRLVAHEDIPTATRMVTVQGITAAVLICEEILNERVRGSVNRLDMSLTVDLGHLGMCMGLVPAMTRIAPDGRCTVAHAQHLADSDGRAIHLVDADGVLRSVSADANGLVWQGRLWAGWAMRDDGNERGRRASAC